MEQSCDCPADGGVIRHQRATCTDGIVAWFGWYADEDPPGTIEDIVALSVEHQSRYRNELRHLPEPRDQREADELAAMRETVERRSQCRHGWPGRDCGSAHPYIAEPTDLTIAGSGTRRVERWPC